MSHVISRHGRILLILLAVAAIALAACSGSSASATPAPGGNGTPAAANTPAGGGSALAPVSSASGGTSALNGAAAALSNISSYKFKMTVAGGDWGQTLSAFSGAATTGNTPTVISGTIILKPASAMDLTVGVMHVIEVGGNDYLDLTGSGTFISSPATTSMDAFAPSTMFSSMIDPETMSDFTEVGTEPKNGVTADHYQGTQAALADLGPLTNVQGATWTADLWIATDGGYPVSMAIVGTAADNTVAYEILFDITNVNDPANTVTAPNV